MEISVQFKDKKRKKRQRLTCKLHHKILHANLAQCGQVLAWMLQTTELNTQRTHDFC